MLRSRTGKTEPYNTDNDTEDEYEKSPIKKTIKKFDLHQKIKPSALSSNGEPTKKRSGIFGWTQIIFKLPNLFYLFFFSSFIGQFRFF